jgi:hypothetical protein
MTEPTDDRIERREQRRCGKCGNPLLPKETRCRKCSASANEAITASSEPPKPCPNCGARIRDTAVICTMCGLNLRTGEILRSAIVPTKPRKHRSRLGMVVLYMMFLCILGWIVFLVGPPEAQPGASLFSDKGFLFLMVLWGAEPLRNLNLQGR